MALARIGSSHPSVRAVSAARRGIGPRARGRIALEGAWAHEYAVAASADIETFLWCTDLAGGERARACAESVRKAARESYLISARTLARLHAEDGLLSVARLPAWDPARFVLHAAALVLVADGIEYAGNLGSLIRTADACGAQCLLLTNSRARRQHPKVFGASRGTVLTVPVLEFAEVDAARAWLRDRDVAVYLADPGAPHSYHEMRYPAGRTAFVVGSEGRGVSREWYGGAQPVAIPMLGAADSLNVTTSAGILLYDARARRPARPPERT